MQKLLVFFISIGLLASCSNNDELDFETVKARDEATIEAANEEQNLGLTKSESGIYYKIEQANEAGRQITTQFEIYAVYTLKNLAGTEILRGTAEDSVIINLFRTDPIQGFIAALGELREGEKGLFYIPSYLAYLNEPIAGLDEWEPIILELEVPRIFSESEQIDLYYERRGIEPDTLYDDGISAVFIDINEEGAPAIDNPLVNVTYSGSFLDGVVFDEGNYEVNIDEGEVIVGFKESIRTMKVGEKAVFLFTSDIGYGESGFGSTIPPFTPLRFEIELISAR